LTRAKESVRRAVDRFKSQVAQQVAVLDEREQRLDSARTTFLEARREFAREQMRFKASVRANG
jgi:hypothetical protein